MSSINAKMAKGAAWTLLFRVAAGGIGLVSTAILARLLTPADFGIVALAMAFIGAMELMRSFGFDVALIQDQSAPREKYDTAWTINILVSLTLAAVVFLAASPIAAFYDDPRLEAVTAFLALGVAIEGFENVGVVEFRKTMRFDRDFIFMVSKKLAGFAATIPLALYLRSYWALVVGMLVTRVAGIVLSYLLQAFRPRFSFAAWRELFGFSFWLLLNNILFFLQERAASFVVGKYAGARGVGLYTLGYEVSHIPSNELVAPINRAVFPGYAKIAGNLAALRTSYLQVMSLISMFAIPAATGLAAVSDLAVPVLLGNQWTDAVGLVQVLAFASLITTIESNVGTIYLALGKPRLLTIIYGFYVAVLLVMLALLVPEGGAAGAANGYLIAACATLPVHYWVMRTTLGVTLPMFLGVVWRPALAAAGMYIVLDLVRADGLIAQLPQIVALFVSVAIGAALYVIGSLLLWALSGRPEGAETQILQQLRVWLARSPA